MGSRAARLAAGVRGGDAMRNPLPPRRYGVGGGLGAGDAGEVHGRGPHPHRDGSGGRIWAGATGCGAGSRATRRRRRRPHEGPGHAARCEWLGWEGERQRGRDPFARASRARRRGEHHCEGCRVAGLSSDCGRSAVLGAPKWTHPRTSAVLLRTGRSRWWAEPARYVNQDAQVPWFPDSLRPPWRFW
jgi:hypothetical protein